MTDEKKLSLSSSVELNNGTKMPRIGLGLSHNNGGFSREATLHALKSGVCLFDTAKVGHSFCCALAWSLERLAFCDQSDLCNYYASLFGSLDHCTLILSDQYVVSSCLPNNEWLSDVSVSTHAYALVRSCTLYSCCNMQVYGTWFR